MSAISTSLRGATPGIGGFGGNVLVAFAVLALGVSLSACGGSASNNGRDLTSLPPSEYAAEQQVAAYVKAYDAVFAPTTHPPANPADLAAGMRITNTMVRQFRSIVPPPKLRQDYARISRALEAIRKAGAALIVASAHHASVAANNAEAANVAAQGAVNASIRQQGYDIRRCLTAHDCAIS